MTVERQPTKGWPIAATLAVVAMLLYVIRLALLPFVLGIVVGFVTDPLIRWLGERTGWPRWTVVAVLYLLFLVLAGAAGYGVGRIAFRDISDLAERLPGMLHHMAEGLVGPQGIEMFGQRLTADALTAEAKSAAGNLLGAGLVARIASLSLAFILGGFLTLVLIPYFMVSGPTLARGAVWLVPPERRPSVERTLPRVLPVLRRYFVGVIVVVCFTATAAWIGYGLIFHLPHAILLSIAVGLLEMIPALGPLASGALVAMAALQEHSFTTAAFLIGYAIALRLLIDNLVGPLVLGQSVQVHPVVVIFAFVSGAILFGVIGLLLAVPVAACIRIVLDEYYAEPVAEEASQARTERTQEANESPVHQGH